MKKNASDKCPGTHVEPCIVKTDEEETVKPKGALNAKNSDMQKLTKLKTFERKTIGIMKESLVLLNQLAEIRADCKMSNSRVTGVAKELKELIKVMSVYV